jgi:hypothetical protein
MWEGGGGTCPGILLEVRGGGMRKITTESVRMAGRGAECILLKVDTIIFLRELKFFDRGTSKKVSSTFSKYFSKTCINSCAKSIRKFDRPSS